MNNKVHSGERIKELLEIFRISQQEFAERTHIDKATVSLYVNKKREPKQINITAIADAFNVDPAWVMGLDVPMNKNLDISINSKDTSFFIEFEQMPDEIKKQVEAYAKFLMKSNKEK